MPQHPGLQTLESDFAEFAVKAVNHKNCFWPRRVRGQKHLSGCKCGICLPTANKFCAQQTAKKLVESPEGDFRHVKIPDAAASGIGFLISLPGFHFFRNLNAAQNTELVIAGIAGFRKEHQPHIWVLKGDKTCLLGGAAGIHSA